jgi:hypothetical protein
MFQFPWFTSAPYIFRNRCQNLPSDRLPDSGTPGSMPVCGSPRLIAAYCALLRLLTPRHPLNALSSLIIRFIESFFPCKDSSVKDRSYKNSLFFSFYGDERIRTADPLLARQVLSQLSYTPFFSLSLYYGPIWI